MPRIRSSLGTNDKNFNNDVEPVKVKSKPDWHFCYVCKQWFFMPIEDYRAFSHYDLHRITELVGKSDYHRIEFGPLLKLRPQQIGKY